MSKRKFRCAQCGYSWEIAHGAPRPSECSQCKSVNVHRAEEAKGYTRRGGRGRGRSGFGRPSVKGKR